MMNKKGFVARDFVVAMLLLSGFLSLFILMVGGLADDYNNPNVVNQEFADKFNKFDENVGRTSDMFEAVSSKDGLSLIGTFDVLFSSTFSVISLIFAGVVGAGQQLAGFAEFFNVPTQVASVFFTLIFGILTALIIFIVVSSVSRRDL